MLRKIPAGLLPTKNLPRGLTCRVSDGYLPPDSMYRPLMERDRGEMRLGQEKEGEGEENCFQLI